MRDFRERGGFVVALTDDEVSTIARLARLELAPEEIPEYRGNLERLLVIVDELAQINTDEVLPMAHPLDLEQRLRPDVVTERDEREANQSGAPSVVDGLYVVPKVID